MNYNLNRFNTEAGSTYVGLGFSSMDELKECTKTALMTMRATKGTPILPNLDEDETVALWYTFYGMVMVNENSDMGLNLIGNSVAEVCRAAAFNGFSTMDALAEIMPDTLQQAILSEL